MQRKLVVSNTDSKVVVVSVRVDAKGRASFSGSVFEKNLYTSEDIYDMACELAEEVVYGCPQWFIDNPTSSFNDLKDALQLEEVLPDLEDYRYIEFGDLEAWEGTAFGQCIDEVPQVDLARKWKEHHLEVISVEEINVLNDMLDSIELNVNQEWGF